MSIPMTYTQIRDAVENTLSDSSNTVFTTAELDYVIADALREISTYAPYLMKETFQVETRFGTATATTASALVDTAKSQFTSSDVGKVVYNWTDRTWAQVTAYVSTSQVTLSKDIMASGEQYYLYNQNCYARNQIYIGNVTDWVGISNVEFEVGHIPPHYRNYNLLEQDKVLEIGIDFTPDDTSQTAADKDVYVYFDKRHRISQLTDLAAAVNNSGGYAAGATTMVLDALQATGTIEEDTLFTVANMPGVYRVDDDIAVSTSAATITFQPGLANAVVNDVVVTFIGSTLTPVLEPLFIDLVAARAAINHARNYIGNSSLVTRNAAAEMQSWGQNKLGPTLHALRKRSRSKVRTTYSRSR